MKRYFLHTLLAGIVLSGCSSSAEEPGEPIVVDAEPQLTVALGSTSCAPGKTIAGTLTITQRGADTSYAIAATLDAGRGRVLIDGVNVPTAGEWISLASTTADILITPLEAGVLKLSLQAKAAADDALSAPQRVEIAVWNPAKLVATARCEERLVNPAADHLHPIALTLSYRDTEDEFTIRPASHPNKGTFLYRGAPVGEEGIRTCDREVTIHYRPAAIGEHLLGFEVSAGEESAEARAYVNIVKAFTVTCDITEGITIAGDGEYDTEGDPVALSMANRSGYNFEVDGWYDTSGKLLSSSRIYTFHASYASVTDICLRLKKRTVTFTREPSVRMEYKYPIVDGGAIVGWESVFDHRMIFVADYNPTDDILVYYEKYRYSKTVPPVAQRTMVTEKLWGGYFWRIDDDFRLSIRKADNPLLTFDAAHHAVESASTRYLLPATITLLP